MTLWAGLAGSTGNACVALCTRDQILGICEQERITRVRAAGFNSTGLPDEALDELLRRAGRDRGDVTGFALAEGGPAPTSRREVLRLEHHFGHACSAFLPSPFDAATIVICDHQSPQVSVWEGHGTSIARIERPWHGPGFAEVYSQCAETLGFTTSGREQRMEALARLDPAGGDEASDLFSLDHDRFRFAGDWRGRIEGWVGAAAPDDRAAPVAARLQARIGDLLVAFLADVARERSGRRLCVGGSLFSNSYLNSRLKRCGLFDEVFVPINPGTAGLALGAALHASHHPRQAVTPFLGPEYPPDEIKATLDNCKLNYEWASESDTVAIAVDALRQGQLVAWFDEAMEWGPRALGARSILANPFAPYMLENLNQFLKHRERWRGFALSGAEAAVAEHFDGPPASPFMECDYTPRDRGRFQHILPGPRSTVRIHTTGDDAPPRFRALLDGFREAAGIPIVVNTSFNGFREPIVCSPRDAVRVFYGTGLDVLVFNQFVIRK